MYWYTVADIVSFCQKTPQTIRKRADALGILKVANEYRFTHNEMQEIVASFEKQHLSNPPAWPEDQLAQHHLILTLRIQGYSFQQIGRAYGKTRQWAHQRYQQAMETLPCASDVVFQKECHK